MSIVNKVGLNVEIKNKKNNKGKITFEYKNLEQKHKKILDHYFNQRWQEAQKEISDAKRLCKNLMSDYYEMMSKRINEFKKSPPPFDCDGVFIATSK